MQGKRKKKRKLWIATVIILLLVIAVVIGFVFLRHSSSDEVETIELDDGNVFIPLPDQDPETVTHTENCVVYRPGTDAIAYDEDAGTLYYNNIIFAYLLDNPSDGVCAAIAESVGGEVVGYTKSDSALLQIKVPETDLATLQDLADTVMESEYVMYAAYDFPVVFENASDGEDNNPWSADGTTIADKGKNSDQADGNDWWAEAIDAYTAWDNYAQYTNEIKVAVIDSGFYTEHEEISGKITMLNANSPAEHGTEVAALIAAKNDDKGLRGVADQTELIGIDWAQEVEREPNLRETIQEEIQEKVAVISDETEDRVYTREVSLLTGNMEYLALMDQAIQEDTKIVNMSFGSDFPSVYNVFMDGDSTEDLIIGLWRIFADKTFNDFDKYKETLSVIMTEARTSGLYCLLRMQQMYFNGNDDYLLVQASGNGIGNGANFFDKGQGVDAEMWTGDFCAIDQEIYDLMMQLDKVSYHFWPE